MNKLPTLKNNNYNNKATNNISSRIYSNNSNEILYTKASTPLDFSFKDLETIKDLRTAIPRKGLKKHNVIEPSESNLTNNKNDNDDKTLINKAKKKRIDNSQEVVVEGKVFGNNNNDNINYYNKNNTKDNRNNLSINTDLNHSNIKVLNKFNNNNNNKSDKLNYCNIKTDNIRNETFISNKTIRYLPYTNTVIMHSNNIVSLDGIDTVLDDILPDVEFLDNRSNYKINYNLDFCKVDLIQWIDLSHNKLTTISSDIVNLKFLKILYLHANYIQELKELTVLSNCNALINLTLHGNPIEHIKGYRLLVIEMIQSLEKLDFTLVSEKELDIINYRGAYFGEVRNKKGKVVVYPSIDKEILKRMNIINNDNKKEL